MIRKAVLIASPLKQGQRGYLPGVEMDVENYKAFLMSPIGGGWLPNDIVVLWNPKATELKSTLHKITADYVFTVYSGHGGTDKNSREGFLNINDREFIWLKDLTVKKSKRQLAVIDACSSYVDTGMYHLEGPEMITFTSDLPLNISRLLFEKRIMTTAEGWTVMHSASPGQASIDTQEGGYFSRSLLNSASIWGAQFDAKSILPAISAHLRSQTYIKKVFQAQQTPRIWHSKSNPSLPFAFRLGTELRNKI